MDRAAWQALAGGANCRMDAPRPASSDAWDLVASLSVSSLYLTTNQTYRGHCQLVFDPRHVARLDQLTVVEWTAFCADLQTATQSIVAVVRPDHVNVESLGNVVPHLHWHIIPRYVDDARWGSPIWMTPSSAMPDTRLEPSDRQQLVAALRAALTARPTSGG
jgi:diadenosine tetraphosphate (Ap4A) HIT family hydrolase